MPVRIHNLGDTLPTDIEYIEVDAFAGKGVLLPFEVFRTVGLYNSALLPHYHADTEFTLRARKSGYRLLYSYKSRVLSHQNLTGTGTMNKSLIEFIRSFSNIKSAIHYKSLLNFSKLVYGRKYRPYLCWQIIRIVLGYFKRFFKKSYSQK
jgi:GT2 family glycosyltransferase